MEINQNMLVKIINEEWNHSGFKYKLGTNILIESFNDNKSKLCGPGGLYYIYLKEIINYYNYGTNLALVSLPENDPDLKFIFLGKKFRANKINIDKVFSLFDINTYKKFNLNISDNEYIVYFAVKYKNFDFLNWWLESNIYLYYNHDIYKPICENNYLDILQWWIKSGKKLPKISNEFVVASSNGYVKILKCCIKNNLLTKNKLRQHEIIQKSIISCFDSGNIQVLDFLRIHFYECFKEIHIDTYDKCKHLSVLEWWKNINGIFWLEDIIKIASIKNDIALLNWLKNNLTICFGIDYNKYLLDTLSNQNNVVMLQWWKDSGLDFKYSIDAIDNLNHISYDNYVEVLDWWKNSGFKLKYSERSVDEASTYNNINVLNWWKNSGFEIKYSHEAIDKASENALIDILDWWLVSGLELKYSEKAIDQASRYGFIRVLDWWLVSGLELKYSEESLIGASENYNVNVLKWWQKSGLGLYCPDYINEFQYSSEIMDWWENSGLVQIESDY
ncbi:ankyrin repeat protein [Megavirus baoshan]|uniref:Ankyrin repeat protein n=1 Tax=Megavirus baoshan TaxID=2496520 RepID=A0A3S5HL91_9VIRU|nr:ankyrin repeat protein [Megavirus baoshan]AZL89260.1 ankyrin repeat protein [Megavirus baoshan]